MTERIDAFDWSRLTHAGRPATDTPGHLRALLDSEDARAFVAGYTHLWSQTLRPDGGAWPVTAPVALVVAELLDDLRLGPDDPSLRDALLAYLHRVAVAGDLGVDAERLRATGAEPEALACYDAVPEILPRVLPHLTADRPSQRACAAAAVGRLARHPSAAVQRPALLAQLEELAGRAEMVSERATLVFALGDLGGTPRRWLADPVPAVRACAALAATLAADEAATAVLLALTRSPRAFGASLGDMAPPVQFMVPPYPDLVTEALVRRVDGLPALISGAATAISLLPGRSAPLLAPYLRAFFPVFPDGGVQTVLSRHQQAFARYLWEREKFWSLADNAREALLGSTGLGSERAAWQEAATRELPAAEGYSAAEIVVLEGFAAVRGHTGMFFGVGHTDARLPERVVQSLRSEYAAAVTAGLVDAFAVEIESPTRLVLDVRGQDLPGADRLCAVDLDLVFGSLAVAWPVNQVSYTSALCRRVGIRVWIEGHAVACDYVDGMALGPVVEIGVDGSRDGYCVTFDLDTDWLPSASRFRVDSASASFDASTRSAVPPGASGARGGGG